jgi:predicted deacylase
MRLPDWRTRLYAYLLSVEREPFQWGGHDCAHFAAGAVEAMTGRDLTEDAGYSTAIGARRWLAARGMESVADLAAQHFEEIPVLQAQVGDLAVLPGDGDVTLGVVTGDEVRALHPLGAVRSPLTEATRAFRV